MIMLRNASVDDAESILRIYDYYVKNTAITFECDTPSLAEFKARMKKIMIKYPYLVILKDDVIVGYAYAYSLSDREAYAWSCETTVYIDCRFCGQGMGKMLYNALETELKSMGIANMYACVAYTDTEDEYLTKNSADFHAHMNFENVGHFHKCGRKFGRWYDVLWLEKIIAKHSDNNCR